MEKAKIIKNGNVNLEPINSGIKYQLFTMDKEWKDIPEWYYKILKESIRPYTLRIIKM